ncbi:hypothetical protein [Eubacterium sp. 1001713B170207_170306_E7]|uniref:hypothetical protein n=1 Tax=Eubacterium sp. 1001713B170207_170306_E7 TaxID=2787097 RepID=UPI00189B08C6|nr:hypothetical protein [Eubacterium sp. 1001713B170207_170306_E7]
MTIFDDLGKTLNDVAAATADMLGDLAETAKVKTTIVSEKHEMETLLAELGRTVYDARKDNLAEDSDDPSDVLCRKILEKEEKIAELEAREEEMKAKEEAKEEAGKAAEDTEEEAVSDAEVTEEEETEDKDGSKDE